MALLEPEAPLTNSPRTPGGGGRCAVRRPQSPKWRCHLGLPASLSRLVRRSPVAHAEFVNGA
jgi:hypothetical protein